MIVDDPNVDDIRTLQNIPDQTIIVGHETNLTIDATAGTYWNTDCDKIVIRQTREDADTYSLPDFFTFVEFTDVIAEPVLVMEPTHEFYDGTDTVYYLEAWCYDSKDYVAINTFTVTVTNTDPEQSFTIPDVVIHYDPDADRGEHFDWAVTAD